jgi:uncharacterized protein (UPF0333 family)
MNNNGQFSIEYLMIYGAALIVILFVLTFFIGYY